MEAFAEIVDPVLERLVDPMLEKLKSVVDVEKIIKGVKSDMELLCAMRNDVRRETQDPERQRDQEPTEMIKWWLKEVDSVERDVNNIIDEFERAMLGDYSSRFWRIGIGKKAKEEHEKIRKLHEEGTKYVPSTIWAPLAPISRFHRRSEGVGLTPYIQKLQEYLEDDTTLIIGICGMGGVGKTTLLDALADKLRTGNCGQLRFDHVIWASQPSTIESLQKIIANTLQLELTENADTETTKIKISKCLEESNFLLLLDDVWKYIDLDSVGIRTTQDSRKKHKVIVTTRSKKVFARKDVKTILLECLKPNDAWNLLQEGVGMESIYLYHVSRRAKRVVDRCCGLPLAVTIFGRAMSETNEADVWDYALRCLEESEADNVKDMDILFGILEHSYNTMGLSFNNTLSNILRQCFLTFSLWPDNCIEFDELVSSWMGLDVIPIHKDISAVYQAGEFYVRSLCDVHLLDTTFYEDKNIVKIHRVMHKVGIWIALGRGRNKQQWIVRSGFKDKWKTAERISLHAENQLPPYPRWCDKLKVMKLSSISVREIQDGFFQYMKSLTYLDLSYTSIEKIPRAIATLSKLKYLNVSYTKIKSLPLDLCKLDKLEYLILRHNSHMTKLPKQLISRLQSLRLVDAFPFGSIDPKSTQGLQQLMAIGTVLLNKSNLMEFSSLPIRWLRIHELEDSSIHLQLRGSNMNMCLHELEVVNCDSLVELVVENQYDYQPLQSTQNLLQACKRRLADAILRNGFREKIFVEGNRQILDGNEQRLEGNKRPLEGSQQQLEDDQGIPPLGRLKLLKLKSLKRLKTITWKCDPLLCLENLRRLEITDCPELTDISWIPKLPCLISLILNSCAGVKQVIGKEGFSNLQILKLEALPQISRMWNGVEPSLCPQNLRRLQIVDCNYLINLSWVRQLPHLAHLTIRGCLELEQIIGNEDTGFQVDEEALNHVFCNLEKLELQTLPRLSSICNYALSLQCLTSVSIFDCDSLKNLPFRPEIAAKNKMLEIKASRSWWEALEWTDENVKASFKSYFIEHP